MPLVLIQSDPKAREKPCLRCGYSLRKILDARNCPECGLSVWVSLNQNDSLDWSRPEWLRQISLGALVMAGAQALGMVMAGVVVPLYWQNYDVLAWVVGVYLVALHGGMMLLGVPEKRYPDRLKAQRWFLLGAGAVGMVLGMFVLGYAAMGRSVLSRWGWFFWVVEMVLLIGAAATLLYIRKLAHRLGSHRLARVLGWLLLIPLLKFVQAFPIWGTYLAFQFFSVTEFLPIIYIPISMGILIYLAIGFRKAAGEAEINWAKAG